MSATPKMVDIGGTWKPHKTPNNLPAKECCCDEAACPPASVTLDLSGLDAALCPDCFFFGFNFKNTSLSVDGSYSVPFVSTTVGVHHRFGVAIDGGGKIGEYEVWDDGTCSSTKLLDGDLDTGEIQVLLSIDCSEVLQVYITCQGYVGTTELFLADDGYSLDTWIDNELTVCSRGEPVDGGQAKVTA